MGKEIHNCKSIKKKPIDFFFQKGIDNGEFLIVGESLPKDGWIQTGRAFYKTNGKICPTGKRLNEELKLLGLSCENCSFTEVAKCFIGNNRKILPKCAVLQKGFTLSQIKYFGIRFIFTLGVTTKSIFEDMFGVVLPIGEISTIKFFDEELKMLPLYHPSPANPLGHSKNINFIKKNKKEIEKIKN